MGILGRVTAKCFGVVIFCLLIYIFNCLRKSWHSFQKNVIEDKTFKKNFLGIRYRCENKNGVLHLRTDEIVPLSSMKAICLQKENEIIVFEKLTGNEIFALFLDGKIRYIPQHKSETLIPKEMQKHMNIPLIEGMLVEKISDGEVYEIKSVRNNSFTGVNVVSKEERALNRFDIYGYNRWIDE